MQKKKERFKSHKEWLEHPLSKELLEVVLPREESRVRTLLGFGMCKDWEEYTNFSNQATLYQVMVDDIADPHWFWDEKEEEEEQ